MVVKNNNRMLAKNISISLIVQVVSLSVSFILNFAIPKFVDVYQYSYWQSFVLYLSYVGVLHFGLLDGIVLRYSQYDYEQLNKQELRSQFVLLLLSLTIIASIGIVCSLVFLDGVTKKIVIFVCVGIISKNVLNYNSYTFQITNRIKCYGILVITQRLTYGIIVIILLFFRDNRFEMYCLADLFGDIAGILFASFYNKGLYFGSLLPVKKALNDWKTNIKAGIVLMFANWSSILLLSSAKMIVQWHWDELVFGKVAFSFTVSNLFLAFVTAVSIVLFPALKRMESSELPRTYSKIRSIISPMLLFSLVFFFPGRRLLELFLPKYSDSIVYLGILLPIIVFSSKVSLLTNNYLKAYRKEKNMLYINLLSTIVGVVLFMISSLVFNDLNVLLVSIVISVAINSIASEWYVKKIVKVSLLKDIIAELCVIIIFIASTMLFNNLLGCVVYCATIIAYSILFRDHIAEIKKSLESTLLRKR